ncbi:hypothetical protein D3C83_245910 [compost metagenome]
MRAAAIFSPLMFVSRRTSLPSARTEKSSTGESSVSRPYTMRSAPFAPAMTAGEVTVPSFTTTRALPLATSMA